LLPIKTKVDSVEAMSEFLLAYVDPTLMFLSATDSKILPESAY